MGQSFKGWLRAQEHRDDEIGELARLTKHRPPNPVNDPESLWAYIGPPFMPPLGDDFDEAHRMYDIIDAAWVESGRALP